MLHIIMNTFFHSEKPLWYSLCGTYHWLVVERESLHGSQGIGGAVNLFENNKGLTLHLHVSCDQDVQNLPEL